MAPDSTGSWPRQRRALGPDGDFSKAARAALSGQRPRGPGGAGRWGPRGGSGEHLAPLPTGPRHSLGERAVVAPQAWARDGRKTSRRGPFRPGLAPAPGWLCRIRAALASPPGCHGSPGPVGEPGLRPSCLTPPPPPVTPPLPCASSHYLIRSR